MHACPVPLAAPETLSLLSGFQQLGAGLRGSRPQGTRDWLLVASLGGAGALQAGGQWHALQRGDLFLIAPHTPQAYGHGEVQGHWTNIWVHFHPRAHCLPWLQWPVLASGVMLLRCGPRMDEIELELRSLVQAAQQPSRLAAEASMNRLERVLIAADELNPGQPGFALDARIRRALALIAERLAQPLASAGLAAEVGLSRARFSTLFTRQLGVPPQAYIETQRLTRAAQLLQGSSWHIGQIADAVGFHSPFYFSTRFSRRYGLSPVAYRLRQSAARLPCLPGATAAASCP